MSKILFTHSYFYKFDIKQWKAKQLYPPYGTIVAASLMRKNGFDVQLFDSNLAEGPEEIIPVLEKENPEYLVIYDDGFNYLTKMCLTNMREAAFELIKYGKENRCIVIVFNSDSADNYNMYLQKNADYVIIGEGEVTLKELIGNLEKKSSVFENIDGIVFQNENGIVKTNKRTILQNIDSLPLPAWDLIDIDVYKRNWQKYHTVFSLNIATTRGCPYKCNWCAKPIYGNSYNSRSPENVVKEIEFLLQNYQPQHFWFCDDIFGLKPGWIEEFRNLVKAKNLKFSYNIQSRVDLLLNEITITALSESGLDTVWVGAESGSQKILDNMEKGTAIEQIYRSTKLLQSKNIKVGFFLQFGFLNETKNDIDKTIKMLLEIMPEDIGVSVSYPLPGTKFYEKVKNDFKGKTNWNDSDDLEMMFQNTYRPVFYKQLHRYVHRLFRRKQAVLNLLKLLNQPLLINKRHLRNVVAIIYYTFIIPVDYLKLKIYSKKKF